MKKWVVFYTPDGRELLAYTLEGTFEGELEATKNQLAHENGIRPEDITVKLEEDADRKKNAAALQEARDALLTSFPNSFINPRDEFIAHERSNQYIILSNCRTPEDIECKVLEWFSRPAHKTAPYSQEWRNQRFHEFMLQGVNNFLDTAFSEDDIAFIYDVLGNACKHSLTVEFVRHGMSIAWLKEEVEKRES